MTFPIKVEVSELKGEPIQQQKSFSSIGLFASDVFVLTQDNSKENTSSLTNNGIG